MFATGFSGGQWPAYGYPPAMYPPAMAGMYDASSLPISAPLPSPPFSSSVSLPVSAPFSSPLPVSAPPFSSSVSLPASAPLASPLPMSAPFAGRAKPTDPLDTSDLVAKAHALVQEIAALKEQKQGEYNAMFRPDGMMSLSPEQLTASGERIEAAYEPRIQKMERELQRLSFEEALVQCVARGEPVFPPPEQAAYQSPTARQLLADARAVFLPMVRPYAEQLSGPVLNVVYPERSDAAELERNKAATGATDERFKAQWLQNIAAVAQRAAAAGLPAPVFNEASVAAAVEQHVRDFRRSLNQQMQSIAEQAQTSQMFHELNMKIIRAMPTGSSSDYYYVDQYGRRC